MLERCETLALSGGAQLRWTPTETQSLIAGVTWHFSVAGQRAPLILANSFWARLSVQGNYQHVSVCAPLLGQVLHFCAATDGTRLAKQVCPLMDTMTRNRLMVISSADCGTVGRRNEKWIYFPRGVRFELIYDVHESIRNISHVHLDNNTQTTGQSFCTLVFVALLLSETFQSW